MSVLGHQACPHCPSSDAFYRWPDGGGHCFSCNYHEAGDKVDRFLQLGKRKEQGIVLLPEDFGYYIPKEPSEWLGQYNLFPAEMAINRIGWSDLRSSLVFPVFGEKDELLFYQSRYFGMEKKPKWYTVPKGVNKLVTNLTKQWPHDTIVLVEDIISKIKVERVTNCLPLFGSHVPMGLYLKLSKRFKRAVVWLDPDKKKEAVEHAIMIGAVMPCSIIFSDKDPKYYNTNQITEYLNG